MENTAVRLLLTLFVSGQGLICLFSFLGLVFVSHARTKIKNSDMKAMVENLLALAFVTYLFTFFNILIKGRFIRIHELSGEFILNAFLVLIIIVVVKTTGDIITLSRNQTLNFKIKRTKKKSVKRKGR